MSAVVPEILLDPLAVGPAIREPWTGTSPAAGADFTLRMDGRYTTRLLSLHVKLVASADVAAREITLEFRDDQNVRFRLAAAPVTWPASTTVYYEFDIDQDRAEWVVDSAVLVPLPSVFLPPGWNFRVHVVNIQATDALTELRGIWERFYTDGPT